MVPRSRGQGQKFKIVFFFNFLLKSGVRSQGHVSRSKAAGVKVKGQISFLGHDYCKFWWPTPWNKPILPTKSKNHDILSMNWLPLLAIHQVARRVGNWCNCLKLDVWRPVAAVAAVPGIPATILENPVTPETAATAASGHHTSSCRRCWLSCRMSGQLHSVSKEMHHEIIIVY